MSSEKNNTYQPVKKEDTSEDTSISTHQIDPKAKRFPYCIVWTPLPIITYILPCIGHTGICTSTGISHDFAGSYFIGVDDLAFGETHKYVQLDLTEAEKQEWDKGIQKSDNKYSKEAHNLFTNNCHSHVAHVLNMINYKGRNNYDMTDVFKIVNTKGKYVSWFHILKTYIGFIIFIFIMLYLFKK